MTEQELIDKIKELIQERDNLISGANKLIGELNGKIEVYQEWLKALQLPASKPDEDKH